MKTENNLITTSQEDKIKEIARKKAQENFSGSMHPCKSEQFKAYEDGYIDASKIYTNNLLILSKEAQKESLVVPEAKSEGCISVKLLERYSKFLSEHGYMDDDWWTEKPTAIERFMKESHKEKV